MENPTFQIQDLGDDELRQSLSSFMEDVPPVIDSTRELLRLKLSNFLNLNVPTNASSVAYEEVQEDDEILFDSPNIEIEPMVHNGNGVDPTEEPIFTEVETRAPLSTTKKRKKPSTVSAEEPVISIPPVETSTVSPSKRILSSPAHLTEVYESAKKNYPGGIPIYHREPLYPDRPDLNDPYSDYQSPVTETLLKKRAAMRLQTESGGVNRSFSQSRYTAVSASNQKKTDSSVFPRYLIGGFLLAIICLAGYVLFNWDPFYKNPIRQQ